MSRQNYYACRRSRQRQAVDEGLILALARMERRLQPRLGCRKLLVLTHVELAEQGIQVGRDRFFEILSEAGMLVERKPSRARTTDSRHNLPVFHNLFAGMVLCCPNQAWVSDLTYIRTEEGFIFGALITDAYSRKIVGHHPGDSLEVEGCLVALDQALSELPEGQQPLHHSDRGCQYCCHEYVARLQARGLSISMTEVQHCYENALAERVNGILKQEYELDRTFRTKAQAKAAFRQAVDLYNHRRPHLKLNYRVPAAVHAQAASLAALSYSPAPLRSALGPTGHPCGDGLRAAAPGCGHPLHLGVPTLHPAILAARPWPPLGASPATIPLAVCYEEHV